MSELVYEQDGLMSEIDEKLVGDVNADFSMHVLDTTPEDEQEFFPSRKRVNPSPLHMSSPLVEVRRGNLGMANLSQGNTPLSRSRSNSHTSLSTMGDNEAHMNEFLIETSTELAKMATVNLDESGHSIGQESGNRLSQPRAPNTTSPASPLPPHMIPHTRSSSGRQSKVAKGPYSPVKSKHSSLFTPTKDTRKYISKSRESSSSSLTSTSSKSKSHSRNTSTPKTTFAGPVDIQSCVNAVCVVPTVPGELMGALVLCAASDGTIRLLNAVSGRIVRSYEGLFDRALCVYISMPLTQPDCDDTKAELGGPRIVAAGSRGGFCLWDFHHGSLLHAIATEVTVWGIALLTPYTNVTIANSSEPDRVNQKSADPGAAGESTDYGIALGACSDGIVRAWRVDTGDMLRSFEVHEDSVICIAAFVPLLPEANSALNHSTHTNPIIATGGADFLVHLWEFPSGNVHHILTGHTDEVTAVSIVEENMDNLRVISGSRDRTVRVWDVRSGSSLAVLTGHTDIVCGVCGIVGNFFSSLLSLPSVSTSKERTSDSNTGDLSESAGSSIGDVESAPSEASDSTGGESAIAKHHALSRCPNRDAFLIAASCGADGSVCLWDLSQQKQLMSSRMHKDVVKGVSMAPVMVKAANGDMTSTIMLASCSWDKSVIFYKLDTMMDKKSGGRCVIS